MYLALIVGGTTLGSTVKGTDATIPHSCTFESSSLDAVAKASCPPAEVPERIKPGFGILDSFLPEKTSLALLQVSFIHGKVMLRLVVMDLAHFATWTQSSRPVGHGCSGARRYSTEMKGIEECSTINRTIVVIGE